MKQLMKSKKGNSGFTLIDFVIGVTIIIFLFMGSMMVLHTMTMGSVNSDNSRRASQKLRSVAERLRARTAQEFQTMTMNNEDMTGPFDRQMKVLATVGDIRNDTRTRPVTLVLTYMENGKEKSKTMNFDLSQTRAQEMGALVKVKVVGETTGAPIPGVLVTAPNYSGGGTTAYGETGSDGVVTINAVAVSQAGVTITVNGTSARAFFEGPPATFTKDFTTSQTHPGEEEKSHYDTPIKMKMPSMISGIITDYLTGDPVPNGEVRVFAETPIVSNFVLGSDEATLLTDANGRYSFNRLVPGVYQIRFMGNTSYAAPFRPGDGTWNDWAVDPGPDAKFNLPAESTVTRDFRAIQIGSAHGKVLGLKVNADGTGLELNGDAPSGVYIKIYQMNEWLYDYPSGDFHNGDFTEFWHHSPRGMQNEVYGKWRFNSEVTDSGGEFTFSHISPTQIFKDFPLDRQYGNVTVHLHAASKLPNYVEVLVKGPTATPPWSLSDVSFAVEGYDTGNMFPLGDNGQRFNMKMFAGGLNNSTDPDSQKNMTLYTLETSALSDVSGRITTTDGNGNSINYPNGGYVRIIRADGSYYGGFTHLQDYAAYYNSNRFPAGVNSDITYNQYYYGTAGVQNDGTNTFSFARYLPKALLPTIGHEKVKVEFESNNARNIDTGYTGEVLGRKQISWRGNPAGDFVDIPASDMNLTGLNIWAEEMDSRNQIWNTTVDVVNGHFQTSQLAHRWGDMAYSAEFEIAPGVVVPVNMNVDPAALPKYNKYHIRVGWSDNQDWSNDEERSPYPWTNLVYSYDSSVGKFVGPPIRLMKTAVTGPIYGHVRDAVTGQPIVGVTMNWFVRGFDRMYVPTVANTGPDGDDQYAFDSIRFVPQGNPDMALTISAPGYQYFDRWMSPYDGYTVQYDVYLVPNPPNPADGSGGSTGGGPGGL